MTGTCRFWIGLALLSLRAIPACAATPEDGRRAYDAGRFSDAMGIWAELSRQGNPEAAFGLGLLYDLGNGTPVNQEAAFFWYKAAAENGLPAAEFNVAALYDSGRGVAQSSESAALWYAKAAAHGHHRAQYVLGLLYQQGVGVPPNPDAAAAWFRDAANGGLVAAATRLQALQAAPPARTNAALAAVTLSAPTRNATVMTRDNAVSVELVWVAPYQPQPVRYEVQVRGLGGPTLRSVYTASVTETATIVPLTASPDFYVWTVETIGTDGVRAASEWSWFSVPSAANSERSMESMPNGTPADR